MYLFLFLIVTYVDKKVRSRSPTWKKLFFHPFYANILQTFRVMILNSASYVRLGNSMLCHVLNNCYLDSY